MPQEEGKERVQCSVQSLASASAAVAACVTSAPYRHVRACVAAAAAVLLEGCNLHVLRMYKTTHSVVV